MATLPTTVTCEHLQIRYHVIDEQLNPTVVQSAHTLRNLPPQTGKVANMSKFQTYIARQQHSELSC